MSKALFGPDPKGQLSDPKRAIIGPEKAIIGPEKANYRTRKG